jgi:hypothetical protein
MLAIQEAEIRRIAVRGQLRQTVQETLSQKHPSPKKGLAEWLNVQALISNPSSKRKNSNLDSLTPEPVLFSTVI